MANHCDIFTRKFLTRPALNHFFGRLDVKVFREQLSVHWHDGFVQLIVGDEDEYIERSCWLTSSRHFEISHGGCGGDFAFWIDLVVANDLALEFKGVIVDDWDGKRRQPRRDHHRTFESYCQSLVGHIIDPDPVVQDLKRRWQLQERAVRIPQMFRFNTGPKIYVYKGDGEDSVTLSAVPLTDRMES